MNQPLPRDTFPRHIETARLSLRRPRAEEAALYARLAHEAYATRPDELASDEACAFAEFMIEHWNRYGFGFLVIDLVTGSEERVPIGHAGFRYTDAWPKHWPESYDAIELGYSIVPSARGRGYVTEASKAALTAAFVAFDVSSIYAKCRLDNPESAAVLLRCGMTELEPTDKMRRFAILRAEKGAVSPPLR